MGHKPVRWIAAAQARNEGQPTPSGKVTLQQKTTTDVQPGFVLFIGETRLIALAGGIDSLLLALLVDVFPSSHRRIAAALREAEQTLFARQQAEEALQESEACFHSYFQAILFNS